MQVFYSDNITDQSILIDGQEHHHLVKVLRKNVGDYVFVCNGLGLMLEAEIISTGKKESVLRQRQIVKAENKNPNQLVLAVAPTKNIDRYEWMIEKCTEIGVRTIIPFYSHHSERRRIKLERLQLIALSAMKQSKSLFLPEISDAVLFKDFICKDFSGTKLIASMEESSRSINESIANSKEEEVIIAIGPEGGFSSEEIDAAKEKDFIPITLGSKRLRTETAGVFCSAAYQLR